MKKPNKIYMGELFLYPELSKKSNYNDVEYIRKDALLEWARAYKEEADATSRSRTDNPSHGQSVAMKDLINYINSL